LQVTYSLTYEFSEVAFFAYYIILAIIDAAILIIWKIRKNKRMPAEEIVWKLKENQGMSNVEIK
jgi:hypothetical protein